ncbi:hypothetical protein BDR07DRAFT_973508 [Suillus spraguei]|nr:hypothetical protein BDR07DRAFT_973508 [Suillus spraguei]
MWFCWADTCCIDWSSPKELDKTMPQIFRWYRNAHVCIVHLAESSTLDDFQRDSWFLQIWTLQELLAPVRIKFYGRRGTRSTIYELITTKLTRGCWPRFPLALEFQYKTSNVTGQGRRECVKSSCGHLTGLHTSRGWRLLTAGTF